MQPAFPFALQLHTSEDDATNRMLAMLRAKLVARHRFDVHAEAKPVGHFELRRRLSPRSCVWNGHAEVAGNVELTSARRKGVKEVVNHRSGSEHLARRVPLLPEWTDRLSIEDSSIEG